MGDTNQLNHQHGSRLRQSLRDPNEFTLTFELVPGRGGRSRALTRIVDLAKRIARDGRFHALGITENAGGYPALSPEVLGTEIKSTGTDVIIHLSCKDKNRNQMESLLFAWDRINLRNLLVIAGDYPKEGFRGAPKPVFDLDTVQALDLLTAMNKGSGSSGTPCRQAEGSAKATFFKGVAVSPFKHLEAELVMQYFKLHRKVAAGADFIITQVGYDARKFHELIQYMRLHDLDVPVLGNVFIPNLAVADLMAQGRIPGCVMTSELHRWVTRQAQTVDKGKRARLLLGAKLLAIQKGLGYSGAHIGGPGLTFDDLDFLLCQADALAGSWRELVDEVSFWPEESFYYYQPDGVTGLNTPEPAARRPATSGGPAYALSRYSHELLFEPGGALFQAMKKGCLLLEDSRFQAGLNSVEHLFKFILFHCRHCGDCTLAEQAFLCPQAGCAKYLLNGPCGGSLNGWCEVYPGRKRCHYVRVYERLKSLGREAELRAGVVPPRNWDLNRTSSWANFFRGLDHTRGTEKKKGNAG